MGPLLGASCGYRKTFRVLGVLPGPSRSGQILCARPYAARTNFFFEPILDQENGILVEETGKKTSKKVILR